MGKAGKGSRPSLKYWSIYKEPEGASEGPEVSLTTLQATGAQVLPKDKFLFTS